MKEYVATTRISTNLKKAIISTIATNEKYKNCYFWADNGNMQARSRHENYFHENNKDYKIIKGKDTIEVNFYLSLSRKNTYFSLEIFKNGAKVILEL